jgi:hypothetical protein
VAVCQNVTVQLDNTGNGSTTAAAVDNGSNDACGIGSLSLSQTAFTCANVGANTVTLTVTDVNGNTATCTATVTVEDNVAPVANCQNVTVQLDNTGNGSTTAAAVDNGSSDACGITSLVLSQTAFTCANVGTNTVTLTVTDVNGNTSTCTSTVNVEDNVAPVATCQNLTLYLDGTGNASTTAAAADNGSSDACGVASLVLSQTTFTCANVGANALTLTVTDVNSNTATCTSTVTVLDTLDPTAVCQNVTTYLDSTGMASILATMVDNGSSDICGVDTLTLSMSSFTCSNVGTNNTVLTVTDVNGNTTTCSATVTVMDTILPSITCPGNMVLAGDSSVCGAIANWTAPVTWDNCTVDTVITTQEPGTLFLSGTTTVTYTVTDENGNSTTCSFDVTVNPVALAVVVRSPLQGCGYHLACASDSNAVIGSEVSGGCLPYQYSWSTGDTTSIITGLPAGTYYLTVTDLQGTVVTDSMVITTPTPLASMIMGDTLVCEGDSVGALMVMASGGQDCAPYSYTWSNGATTSSISGLPAGTYTVTVTDSIGCSIVDTAVLQLGINPVLELGPDTTTCPGISVLFEAPPIFNAYQWNTGSNNSVITMTTPGMYICTVWTVDGCTDTDTVNLLEYVVDYNIITAIGSLNICDGDTVTLEGDAGLIGYDWSTGDTTQSIVVAGFGGDISLSATDANGCATADTVTVNYVPFTDPQPVITPGPTAPLCDGGSTQLDVQSGYFAYAWSNGLTTQSITVTTPGVYQVTVSNGFGCTNVSDPVTVYNVPLPNPTVQYISGVLSTTSSYISYQWLLGGSAIPGAINPTHTPIVAGWYSVSVTDSNGCTGTGDAIYVNPVGVAEELEGLEGLVLYPNPSMGLVNLRTLNPIDWPIQVEVWDMFDMAHLMDVMVFDLSDIAAGPYLMKITTFRRNTTQQAVIRLVIE